MTSVFANLRRLGDFKGRQSRARFWPYAGVVIALTFLGVAAVMVPVINEFFANAAALAAEHPEAVAVQAGPGAYSVQVEAGHPEVVPDFGRAFAGIGLVAVVAAGLLAAAVSRRLHDSGLPAWLGLLPLPFLATGLTVGRRVFASFGEAEPNMTLFLAMFLNNMAYMASLGLLVLLLCRAGTAGPNRYGPPAAV